MGTTAGTDGRFEVGVKMGGMRPWLRLFLGISGGAVAIAVALGLIVVLTTAAAQAQPSRGAGAGQGDGGIATGSASDRTGASGRTGAVDGSTSPALLHRLQSHQASGMILMSSTGPMVAPLQSTDARLRVTGNTVRGTVTQRFRNPGTEWLEGSYLFPLPDDAAVDHLRMKVGDRVVQGQIREKQAARRDFARARQQGQRASLVEQKRPNAFTTHVTNIAPGAVIEIELEYQQTLALRDGAWRLRFPGVVAPRYRSSATAADNADSADSADSPQQDIAAGVIAVGAIAADAIATDAIAGGDMHQPLVPQDHAPLNPIRITVELDPGVPIVQPTSASHRLEVSSSAVDVSGNGGGIRYRLQTIGNAEAQEVADRDFELEWSPAAAALPMATLRHERHGDHYYGMLVINPPSPDIDAGERLHREMTFVVDTSGSMGGESIEQARSALSFGLQRLQVGDRFNIIQFNSSHSSLFPAPRQATEANLQQARRYVNRLRADGGTEMRGAIAQALSAPLAAGILGQVVFITDGAVDYEDELVSLVRERVGARRLFTVGIGSAPNGFFMRKAAQIGGGTFTFIGNTSEVERRMARLFEKIAHPMSTDLAVTFEGGVLAEPIGMPRDLYAGEPLILAARFSELPHAVTVSGVAGLGRGASRWRIPVDVTAAQGSGLHVLWARNRIEALSDAIRQARHTATPQDELREKVVGLALDHHLISAYTSLVAVDLTPVRPTDAPMRHGEIPANLPAGWDYEALTGRTAGSAMVPGVGYAGYAGYTGHAGQAGYAGAALAQTATPAPLKLLIGVVLLAIGFLLLLSRRGSRWLACGAGR